MNLPGQEVVVVLNCVLVAPLAEDMGRRLNVDGGEAKAAAEDATCRESGVTY
jgi:hypothetical protein